MERFDQLKDIDEKYYCSSYYDVRVSINMVLRFGKIRVGLMKQILMVDFGSVLDTGQVEDQKMIKYKLIDEKEL